MPGLTTPPSSTLTKWHSAEAGRPGTFGRLHPRSQPDLFSRRAPRYVRKVLLGGAMLLLFVLLSLSSPTSVLGTTRRQHTVLGTLGACALGVALLETGLGWLALAVLVVFFGVTTARARSS